MRSLFALLLLLPLLMPCVGCGGGRPDPRDRPDFVDDTDPSMAAETLNAETGPGAAKGEPGAPKDEDEPGGTP